MMEDGLVFNHSIGLKRDKKIPGIFERDSQVLAGKGVDL
jgi:hypothetical protein